MKHLTLIVAFAFTVMATAFAQNQGYDAVGTVKTQAKEFLVVVNSSVAALTVGEAVCADVTSDDGIAVDYCTASGVPLGIITDTSCAVGARCKLQTGGVMEAGAFVPGRGNAVAGDPAFVHTDGSLYGDTTPADNIQYVGVFLDAATATGAVQVYITK